jgi:hypothetical protein
MVLQDFEKYNAMIPPNFDAESTGARFKKQQYQTQMFLNDVKKDLGIENNPKADKMLSIAWDLGHSCGYSEVYYYARDLVSLIR